MYCDKKNYEEGGRAVCQWPARPLALAVKANGW